MKPAHTKALWISAMICCMMLALATLLIEREPPTPEVMAHRERMQAAELAARETSNTQTRMLKARHDAQIICERMVNRCAAEYGDTAEAKCLEALKPVMAECAINFSSPHAPKAEVPTSQPVVAD
jgi:hypothetical protein